MNAEFPEHLASIERRLWTNDAVFYIAATLLLLTSSGLTVGAQAPTPTASSESTRDATRLRTGRFEHRMIKNGKEIARFVITIQKQGDGNFRFTGEADGFNQRWLSTATRFFEPIDAQLRMNRTNGETYAMDLIYSKRRVTGSVSAWTLPKRTPPPSKPVEASIPPSTVDQRIDWAVVLASRLEAGQKFNFTVYDAETGVSPVVCEVSKTEQIQVPAGSFKTIRASYRIEKSKGAETYEVFASDVFPRILVREDFPNGTRIELTKMSEL
jgi:Protein of unknown function (DUF3108)